MKPPENYHLVEDLELKIAALEYELSCVISAFCRRIKGEMTLESGKEYLALNFKNHPDVKRLIEDGN